MSQVFVSNHERIDLCLRDFGRNDVYPCTVLLGFATIHANRDLLCPAPCAFPHTKL